MLWGQKLIVYTDHKNLMRDALGMTSDRVYRWRVILEEYGPGIVYIKGIHNTVADAISRLDYDPTKNYHAHMNFVMSHARGTGIDACHFKWKAVLKCFCTCMQDSTESNYASLDYTSVFASSGKEEQEEIYPLTVTEIADAQRADKHLRKFFKRGGDKASTFEVSLVEETKVLTENSKLVIPKSLQKRAVMWYHHYLQHPGETRLEETLRATMTWAGLRKSVREYTKRCRACQMNKRPKVKYGK